MDIKINHSGFGTGELAAAKRLAYVFEVFFDRQPCEGEINILNFQLPSGYLERDIDILVLMKIADGDVVMFNSHGTVMEMEGGFIFNIETKSHSHFELYGEEIQVEYANGTKKNAIKQAWNVKNNLISYLKRNIKGSVPWIYDMVFLPMCSRETSLAMFGSEDHIPKNFLDGMAKAEDLFGVIVQNDTNIKRYGNPRSTIEIDVIEKFLCGSKSLPKYYANKLELLTVNSLKEQQSHLFRNPSSFYTLKGSPGAGKTILMLSKCMELISRGKKSLYLTYNKQLVLDLERLQEAIRSIAPSSPIASLRIETWESFVTRIYSFYSYFRPLGGAAPSFADKASEVLKRYDNNDGKELLTKDEEQNSRNIFKYSAIDYVFVDEAQDLPTSVFTILRTFFSKHICLAIGGQQEYTDIGLDETGNELYLEKIHRQREVPSQIVRSFLEHTQLEHIYQMQQPVPTQLVGGESVVYTGVINDELYRQIFEYLDRQGSAKIDFLHLHISQGDATACTTIGHYSGGNVKDETSMKLDKFRYYHFNSCRGLEGNIVLFEKIDSYYEWCINKFGEDQAKKRLFIALTRVKDIAIFTFEDLNHWLYKDVIANFSKIKNMFDLK